ncbi:hypothetical protein ABZQ28_31805 [Pseudomonas aeruginosa]
MTESKICTCPSGDGSLRHPCPAHPAVEQAGGDERAAFEAWATHLPMDRQPLRPDLYMPPTQWAWEAWQFRAALAQPSQAQAEQAEAERPEVVAYFDRNYPSTGDAFIWSNYEGSPYEPVMTVAQHERIVVAEKGKTAAAMLESHRQFVRQFEEGTAELIAQRDAALARVAELERQEPVALANRGLHAFWVKWTEAAAGLYGPGIKLYAAPVAQAQHSVPGDIMRDAQRYRWLRDQQFYFSFSTENSDAGISSCTAGMSSRFKNLSWVDAAIDSAIAAAPGKEVGHE